MRLERTLVRLERAGRDTGAAVDRLERGDVPGRLERGVLEPRLTTLLRLAAALDVSPAELVDQLPPVPAPGRGLP